MLEPASKSEFCKPVLTVLCCASWANAEEEEFYTLPAGFRLPLRFIQLLHAAVTFA